MRHPIEFYNEEQARFLGSLSQPQQAFWARLFRIGNATYAYHTQFDELMPSDQDDVVPLTDESLEDWFARLLKANFEPRPVYSPQDELLAVYFEEWLAGLPDERLRQAERARGLPEARRGWPFRRYVLERHDLGMDEFLRRHLSPDDYQFHQAAAQVSFVNLNERPMF